MPDLPTAASTRRRRCSKTSNSMGGMATGTGAPTSTTAPRSAPPRMRNARSTPLPKSWAVLSGAANPARARLAMDRVDQRLVRRDAQLIQLFDPPFDQSALALAYIKGYPPGGAREWRPVHPRGDLGRDGLCGTRRYRAGVGVVLAAQTQSVTRRT